MEQHEIIILIIAAGVIGFAWGFRIASKAYAEMMIELDITPDDLQGAADAITHRMAHPEEEPEDPELDIYIKIEEHEGSLIAYRLETDEFIAQADDGKTLIEKATEKFPAGITFRIDEANGMKYVKHLMKEA